MPSLIQIGPRIVAVAAFALAAVCAQEALAQQVVGAGSGSEIVGPTIRLAGRIVVPMPAGANLPLDIAVNRWDAVKAEGGSALPLQGFYVAHLLAGTVTVDIGGSSEPHRAGDFWTVPKGAGMIVRIAPPHEAALLETISVTPRILLR